MGGCCPKSSPEENVGFVPSSSNSRDGERPNREILAEAAERRAKEQQSRGVKNEVRLPKSRDSDLPSGDTPLRWQVG